MPFKNDSLDKHFIEFNQKKQYLNIGNQILGRGKNSDIIIDDPSVSSSHLLIYFFNNSVKIMDLNSANGTLINNSKISSLIFFEIKPYDRLILGNLHLTYNIDIEEKKVENLENYCQGTMSILAKYDPADFSKELLENEKLDYYKLQDTNKKLGLLYTFGQKIANVFDLKKLFNFLFEELNKLFPMSSRAIVFLGNENNLQPKVFWEDGKEISPEKAVYSKTLLNLAIKEKKAFIASDFGNKSTELTKSIIALNLQSTMISPLLSENEILGMIILDSSKSINVFKNDDLKLLSGICNLISVRIINKTLLNKINKQAMDLKISNEMLEKNNIELKKAKEEAEKANILKSKFLGNISHELRTPLNSILNFSDLLKKYNDENIINYAERISRNGNRLIRLVNDITELSLMDTEENKNAIFNIRSLIYIKDEFNNKINNKDIIVNLKISQNLPEKICSDLNKIKKILNHLLDNAIKYTYNGTINISFLVNNENKDEIIVKIEDTGIGIPNYELENIFEAFYQIAGEKQEIKGSGLGLTISKKLAKQLNGDITVSSEFGKGSCFTFKFKNLKIEEEVNNSIKSNLKSEDYIYICEVLNRVSNLKFFESSKIQKELENILNFSNSLNTEINLVIEALKNKKENDYKNLLLKLISQYNKHD